MGNNTLVDILRILTSIELHQNAKYYSNHPIFNDMLSKGEYGEYNFSLNNLLKSTLSGSVVDQDITRNEDSVRAEALNNCSTGKWSSFMCILGLSSVLNASIFSHYPEFGPKRSHLLLNRLIKPRSNLLKPTRERVLNVMFCRQGPIIHGQLFQSNHFVPHCF